MRRTTLREQVKEILLERILNGELEAGERIVETQIARELGTSQTPVREALRDLELLRMVESEPFRGSRVRAISPAEMGEVYAVRLALEELAAREAAVRLDDATCALLEEELVAMQKAALEDDVYTQVEHDLAFHRLFVEASGNGALAHSWGLLRLGARTLLLLIQADIDRLAFADRHVPLLDAIRGGDPDVAAAAVREHFRPFASSSTA